MQIFRKILSFLFKTALLLALILGIFWLRSGKNLNIALRQFQSATKQTVPAASQLPAKQDAKEANFQWTYAGQKYSVTETLFGSYDAFYQAQPKDFEYQGALPADWQEQYFAMFLKPASGDDTLQKLAQDIKNAGLQKGLKDDQLTELVMAFVQSIPYDSARAEKILAGQGGGLTNYPYETLYENKGVCSDKSFLAYVLLRDLGYGAALFVYEAENHMAVAVQCPAQYSTYGSGYCYAETTTAGNKIGLIPELSAQNNQAQAVQKLGYFDQQAQFDVKKLGPVAIYEKASGQAYAGIINTVKISQQLDDLSGWIFDNRSALTAANSKINADKTALDSLKKKMDNFSQAGDYQSYNKLVPQYNAMVKSLQKEIGDYNAQVKAYNQKVNQYNALVANFQ